ncbi:MAG: hypothetical protein CMF51_03110 [Legionellales bacterium]|nr:hypothetical protein [Legionellales bacterium]|tara:strand:- start:2692 stop:3261 length:570 start_codon:yes stop_codon:yes gene_type:complete
MIQKKLVFLMIFVMSQGFAQMNIPVRIEGYPLQMNQRFTVNLQHHKNQALRPIICLFSVGSVSTLKDCLSRKLHPKFTFNYSVKSGQFDWFRDYDKVVSQRLRFKCERILADSKHDFKRIRQAYLTAVLPRSISTLLPTEAHAYCQAQAAQFQVALSNTLSEIEVYLKDRKHSPLNESQGVVMLTVDES